MRLQIQSVVECVAMPDGTVGEVRVVRSRDSVHGVDEETFATAFAPPHAPSRMPIARWSLVVVAFEIAISLYKERNQRGRNFLTRRKVINRAGRRVRARAIKAASAMGTFDFA